MGNATRHIRSDEWFCEVCEARSLSFTFVHAECECDVCGAEYTLKHDDKILDEPESIMVPEFQAEFKRHWDETGQSIFDMTQAKFNELLTAAGLPPMEDD